MLTTFIFNIVLEDFLRTSQEKEIKETYYNERCSTFYSQMTGMTM